MATATNDTRVAIYGEWLWGVVHQFISNDAWMYQGCFPAVARDKLDAVIADIAKVYPDYVIVCDGLVRSNVDPLYSGISQNIAKEFCDGDSLEIGSGKYNLGLVKLPAEVSALAVNYLMFKYPGRVMRAPYYAHAQIAAMCKCRAVKGAIGGPEGYTTSKDAPYRTFSLGTCGLFQETAAHGNYFFYTHIATPPNPPALIWHCPVLSAVSDLVPLSTAFGLTPDYIQRGQEVEVSQLVEAYGTRLLSHSEYLGVAFGSLPVDVAYPFTQMIDQPPMCRITRSEFPDFFPTSVGYEGRSDSFMRPLRSQVHLQMMGDNSRPLSITFGRESLNPPVIQLGNWNLGHYTTSEGWCKRIGEYVKYAVHPPNMPLAKDTKVGVQLEARMKSLDLMGYFTHPSDQPVQNDETSGTTPYADALARAENGTEMQIFALIELHRTKVPLRSGLGMLPNADVDAVFLSRLMTLMPLRTKSMESWAGPVYGCINDWVIEVTRQQINFRDLTCVMTYRSSLKSGLLTSKDLQSSFLFHSFPSPLMGYLMFFLLNKFSGKEEIKIEKIIGYFPQIVSKETLQADLLAAYKFLVSLDVIFKSIIPQEEDQQCDYEDFKTFTDYLGASTQRVRTVLIKLGVTIPSVGYNKGR